MKLRIHPSNRFCVAQRVERFSLAEIKKEILRQEDVCGDFSTLDTRLPAANKTVFKAYENGRDLLVAVCLRDVLPRGVRPKHFVMKDSVELFFDPYNDRIGYYQFAFHPDGCLGPIHHAPYKQAHSTAYRHVRLKKYCWDIPEGLLETKGDPHLLYATTDPAWLFAWFEVEDIFRRGGACGFNVARSEGQLNEVTTWNHCSGHGTQDASSFGTLYRRRPGVCLTDVDDERNGRDITLRGDGLLTKSRCSFRLVDPLGRDVPSTSRRKGSTWRLKVRLPAVPGRYRLYATAGKGAAEPRYLALDVSFPKRRPDFKLGMTYDCPDDMIGSVPAYTPESLESEIELFASHGVTRIHWIDYPPETLYRGRFAFQVPSAAVTERNCGDLLPLAASIAKKKGMEFVGIHKPFDIAMDSSNWCKERQPMLRGHTVFGLEGRPIWAPAAVVKAQDSTMHLHPEWHASEHGAFERLRLYSTGKVDEVGRGDIRVWYSRDNQRFTAYRGPMTVGTGRTTRPNLRWTPAGVQEEKGRQSNGYVELSGMRVDAPFLAIEIRKDVTLTHRAFALLEAWDGEGCPVPVIPATGGGLDDGFLFFQEWMSWANKSHRMLTDFAWGRGVHGMAFRRHPNLPTLLEPACEAARDIWLWHVQRVLETEADGVSLRTLCHHNNIMDYMMYAYAEPVRETFRSLYGRNVTPSWADRERVRRIRGDFYTDMLRAANRLAAKAGKALVAHLEAGIEVPPTHDLRMQFYEDWRTWINEGIVDQIILKWWFPQNPFIHEHVLPLARKKGVPVYICDRNSSLRNTVRAVERAEGLMRDAMAAGFAGYVFYEAADVKFRNRQNRPILRQNIGDALSAAARAIESEPVSSVRFA